MIEWVGWRWGGRYVVLLLVGDRVEAVLQSCSLKGCAKVEVCDEGMLR